MTTLRRILLTTSLAVAAGSVASASPIIGHLDFLSSPTTFGPSNTDFTYSLSLSKFDPGTDGVPVGATLTGATIYFYAQENVNTLSLTNTASGVETFTFLATSNITSNSSNSANNADKFGTETLNLFSQTMTLGGSGAPACPESTPSASCSSVAFTPPPLSVTNLTIGFPTGTGALGVDGVTKNIMSGDLANYIGATNFTLGGSTKSFTSFSGGGNNINPAIATTAEFEAEVDYTYALPSSTPEPATMGMVGSGLLGLSWLLRRRRKQVIS
jgi:hypothetical protein